MVCPFICTSGTAVALHTDRRGPKSVSSSFVSSSRVSSSCVSSSGLFVGHTVSDEESSHYGTEDADFNGGTAANRCVEGSLSSLK